jgi:hypothetical protein
VLDLVVGYWHKMVDRQTLSCATKAAIAHLCAAERECPAGNLHGGLLIAPSD